MRKLTVLPIFPTGRPGFVDTDAIETVCDALDAAPPAIVGGAPQLQIVGTQLNMASGNKVILAMPIEDFLTVVGVEAPKKTTIIA